MLQIKFRFAPCVSHPIIWMLPKTTSNIFFSWKIVGGHEGCQTVLEHLKPLHASCLLTLHWLKHITWPNPNPHQWNGKRTRHLYSQRAWHDLWTLDHLNTLSLILVWNCTSRERRVIVYYWERRRTFFYCIQQGLGKVGGSIQKAWCLGEELEPQRGNSAWRSGWVCGQLVSEELSLSEGIIGAEEGQGEDKCCPKKTAYTEAIGIGGPSPNHREGHLSTINIIIVTVVIVLYSCPSLDE